MDKRILERTHSAIIRQIQHFALYIPQFAGYQPPNPTDNIANVNNLVQNLIQASGDEAAQLTKYYLATRKRKKAFETDAFSVKKILAHIRTAIIATEGENSSACELVSAKILAMRGGKRKPAPKKSKPTDTTTATNSITVSADAAKTKPAKTVKKISHSQLSCAALTNAFRDLVKILRNLPYHPYLPELQIPQLEIFALRLTDLNDLVDKQLGMLNTCRRQRNEYLAQARASCRRIYDYVKARYGKNSNELTLLTQPA